MQYVAWILIACSVWSCQGNVACQSSPPTLYLQLSKSNVLYPAATDSTTAVALSYTDEKGNKAYVTDLEKNGPAYRTYLLLVMSRSLKDPTFTIELNHAPVGELQLKTYVNTAPCNGWTHPSEVRLNGKVVTRSAEGYYLLPL